VTPEAFWKLDLGNVLTIGILTVALVTLHIQNVQRIEKSSRLMQDLQTKMDVMFHWFQDHVVGGSGKV
jgi:hypothetical protein